MKTKKERLKICNNPMTFQAVMKVVKVAMNQYQMIIKVIKMTKQDKNKRLNYNQGILIKNKNNKIQLNY